MRQNKTNRKIGHEPKTHLSKHLSKLKLKSNRTHAHRFFGLYVTDKRKTREKIKQHIDQ